MSILKKILNHSLWLLIASFISKFLVFLINILVARFTSVEVYGQYSLIKNSVSTLEGLISGSISTSAAKHVAEYRAGKEAYLKTYMSALLLSVLLSVLVLCVPLLVFPEQVIDQFFAGEKKLIPGLYIGSLILISSAFAALVQNMLIGLEAFKRIAWANIVVLVIALPLSFFLIKNYNLYGALFAVAAYYLLDVLCKVFAVFILEKQKLSFDFREIFAGLKGIYTFSTFLFFSIFINSVSFWYARILLLRDSSNFESLGYFDASFQLITIIYFIAGTVTSAVLPKLSSAFQLKKKKELRAIFRYGLAINFGFAFLIASVFILFSDLIMSLYGKEYVAGSTILQYLSISAVFLSVAYIFHRYLMSVNKVKDILIANILSVICMYTVLWLMAPITGEVLALSIVTYYFVSVLYYAFVVIKAGREG